MKVGVNEKYVLDSIEVVPLYSSKFAYILHSDAIMELDSLEYPSYGGTEGGKHYFYNQVKIVTPPYRIYHFVLDTGLCEVHQPLSRYDEHYREMSKPARRKIEFKNGKCFVSEPEDRSAKQGQHAQNNGKSQ